MLGVNYFYHNSTRKYVDMFGNLFNDITIHRFDANNNTIQRIPVPIAWGNKQKYITMDAKFNAEGQKLQMMLPQMAFSITGFAFETPRKVNPINVILYKDPDNGNVVKSQFAPLPIQINFDLHIMTRTTDDAYQIIEQIVPFFHTSFTNSVKLFPEMNMELDIRTTMASTIVSEDSTAGDALSTKYLTHTLNFTVAGWFAGPVSSSGLIKRVQVDLIPVKDEEYAKYGRQSRIVVTPGLTADGQPTSDPALTIPYSEINPTDPYGFVTQIYFFQDGKKFDPIKMVDVLP